MKKTITTWGWKASVLCGAVVVGGVFGAPAWAMAQTEAAPSATESSPPAPRASEVGHSARAWLDLQRSNAQAAPALPTLGSEAGLAYRRYMESFKSKIPDLYGSALSGTGGSGGNGGVGSGGGGSSAGGLN